MQRLDRFVRVRLRNRVGGQQVQQALVIQPCLRQHRFRARQVRAHTLRRLSRRRQRRLRDGHLLLDLRIIQPCEQLPRFHLVALIHQHLRQPLLNACAHRRLHPRLQRARAHDFVGVGVLIHLRHDHLHRFNVEFINREARDSCHDEPWQDAAEEGVFHWSRMSAGKKRGVRAAYSE